MRFFFGSSCTYKASFSTYMIVKLEKIFKFKIFQAVFVKRINFWTGCLVRCTSSREKANNVRCVINN